MFKSHIIQNQKALPYLSCLLLNKNNARLFRQKIVFYQIGDTFLFAEINPEEHLEKYNKQFERVIYVFLKNLTKDFSLEIF